MLVSSIPYKFGEPWATGAASGYINTIPLTTSVTGAASQTLGFPPATDTPSGAGGVPPSIKDFNGVLQYETAWSQWHQAGGPISYDSTFSTAIGGYPKGAFLLSSTGNFHWISTADNNTTNPDGGSPANWSQLYAVLADVVRVVPEIAPVNDAVGLAFVPIVIEINCTHDPSSDTAA